MTYQQVLADLEKQGVLVEDWVAAFQQVPRGWFIPDVIWVDQGGARSYDYTRIDRQADPAAWEAAAGSPDALVTQMDGETPTSSLSMPYMVALMMRHLNVKDGHEALVIGTGPGWTDGLLRHRLGKGNVTSIEVDRQVYEQAWANLTTHDLATRVILGDGALIVPRNSPFDRLLATCSVNQVPGTWVEETYGTIVTPWGNGMSNGALLVLESDTSTATGRVVNTSSFMWLRSQRPARAGGSAEGDRTFTDTDPREVFADNHRLFSIGQRVPGCRHWVGWGEGDAADECTLWLVDGTSTATADYVPGKPAVVHQQGPRRLWDEVQAALAWWYDHDEPDVTRWGLTVNASGEQRAWLDNP